MWHGAMISFKDAWIEGWKKLNPGISVSGFLSSIAFNEATMRAKIALAKKSLAETRRVVTELKSLRGCDREGLCGPRARLAVQGYRAAVCL